MSTGEPAAPSLRSIFLGIALAVLLLIGLCRIGDLVKYAGVGLLWLPGQLGLVDQVKSEEIEFFDLSQRNNTWQVTQPGQYAVYTANDKLLELSNALESSGKTWLSATTETGSVATITPVRRGLSLLDTPLVPGRPVYTIAVPAAGRYALVHPHPVAQMAIVPDYVTGHELVIYLVLGLELLVITGLIVILYRRRF